MEKVQNCAVETSKGNSSLYILIQRQHSLLYVGQQFKLYSVIAYQNCYCNLKSLSFQLVYYSERPFFHSKGRRML